MYRKLSYSFYQQPALKIVKQFLGKYLVFNSPKGTLVGQIIDVEAYPAYVDKVSHGNKRTKRTEVLYKSGGYIYIYLIYGIHHQFAVVVNKKDVPEVVFIRALEPIEGIEIMKKNFGKKVKTVNDLTKSPGNWCKSFGINKYFYGKSITGKEIYIEDRGEKITKINSAPRVGISKSLSGHDRKYRFFITIF